MQIKEESLAQVLDIVPYKIFPTQNGGQKAIFIFCKCLSEENKLTAVSTRDNKADQHLPFEFIPFFNNSKLRYINPVYYFKLRKIVRNRNIEYIITEHPYMAWLGYFLKMTLGVKWYIRSHNLEYERFRTLKKWWWPLLKLYEQWAYRKADKTLFITQDDVDSAIMYLKLPSERTAIVPFGIDMHSIPNDVAASRDYVIKKHEIPAGTRLLIFNGSLDYAPNYDAVNFIINQINPLLMQREIKNYRIIICGKGLPGNFNNLKDYAARNIIYAGFVSCIETYFKAAHIFLNPVISGGGVKTKLVEAIGFNNTVISSVTGAIGVSPSLCGNKLVIVADNDTAAFVTAIMGALEKFDDTPPAYYEYFYWPNIAKNIQHLFSGGVK